MPLTQVFNIVNEETREAGGEPRHPRAARRRHRRARQPHGAHLEGRRPNGPSPTAPRRFAETAGVVLGAVLVFRDVTDDRKAEIALNRSLAREQSWAARLRQVAAASLTINAATTQDSIVGVIDGEARRILGAGRCKVVFEDAGRCRRRRQPRGAPDHPRGTAPGLHPLRRQGQRSLRRRRSGRADADGADGLDRARELALYNEIRASDARKDEFLATLAHELRNPLAPISNSLQVLRAESDPAQPGRQPRGDRAAGGATGPPGGRPARCLARQPREAGAAAPPRAAVRRPGCGRRDQPARHRRPPAYAAGAPARRRRLARRGSDAAGAGVLESAEQQRQIHGARRRHRRRGQRRRRQVVVAVRDTRHRHRARRAAAHLRLVRAGGPFARARARRTGDRPDAGAAAGRAPRRVGHGAQRRPGHRQRVRRASSPCRGRRGPGACDPAAVRAEAADPLPARRILVVDDNKDAVDSLALLLSIVGQDVVAARDGLDALAQFEQFEPEVVVLDLGLPGINGYEVARRIRDDRPRPSRRRWWRSPAGARTRIAGAPIAAGFDHHLVKPVDFDALKALLAGLPRGN